MSDHILCVRIAQRTLAHEGASKYHRFPFDRVYLLKKCLEPRLKSLFRYYMIMELDQALLDALGQLAVKRIKKTPVIRNDAASDGILAPKDHNHFLDHIANRSDWLMAVPTHVRTVYKKPEVYKEPEKSELSYILTRAIKHDHNRKVRLPQITLVTPTRTIPILCGVCHYSLDLHAGKCLPGQSSCKFKVKVFLAYDNHNSLTHRQSVEASGDY